MSLGRVIRKIFDRLGAISLGWVKLKIVCRLREICQCSVKKKFYRTIEMSGWFGKTCYYQL